MAKEKVGSLEHREYFASCIEECKGDAERLQVLFGEAVGINNTDKKSILEQAFRDVLRNCLQRSEVERYTELMGLSISSAQLGICYHTVPFLPAERHSGLRHSGHLREGFPSLWKDR